MLESYEWYRTGRVSVLNGSRVVLGTSTAWVKDRVKRGDMLILMGHLCEIAEVTKNTEILLTEPYPGDSVELSTYKIVLLAKPTLTAEIALSLRELIDNWPQYEELLSNYEGLVESYGDLTSHYSKLNSKYNRLTRRLEIYDAMGFYFDEDGDIAQTGDTVIPDPVEPIDPEDPIESDDPADYDESEIATDEDIYALIRKVYG